MSETERIARKIYIKENIAACEALLGTLSISDSNKVFAMCADMWEHVRHLKGFTK